MRIDCSRRVRLNGFTVLLATMGKGIDWVGLIGSATGFDLT